MEIDNIMSIQSAGECAEIVRLEIVAERQRILDTEVAGSEEERQVAAEKCAAMESLEQRLVAEMAFCSLLASKIDQMLVAQQREEKRRNEEFDKFMREMNQKIVQTTAVIDEEQRATKSTLLNCQQLNKQMADDLEQFEPIRSNDNVENKENTEEGHRPASPTNSVLSAGTVGGNDDFDDDFGFVEEDDFMLSQNGGDDNNLVNFTLTLLSKAVRDRRYKEAIYFFEYARAQQVLEACGDNVQSRATILELGARAYRYRGHYKTALGLLNEADTITNNMARLQHAMAICHFKLHDYERSEKHCREALQLRKTHDNSALNVAMQTFYLGYICGKQKKFKLLRLYMHQAEQVFKDKLGPDHKMTKKAHKTLLYAASKSNNNLSTAVASTSSQSGISKPKNPKKQKNRQGAENGGTAGVRCVPSTSTSNRQ